MTMLKIILSEEGALEQGLDFGFEQRRHHSNPLKTNGFYPPHTVQ